MITLADSSAWVEFLRDTGSPAAEAVDRLIGSAELVTTDVIVMELLAGARDDEDEASLSALLAVATFIPVARDDWVTAARLQRRCRAGGEPVRRINDCLIAAVAIRANVPVLHRDRDFEVLVRHSALRTMEA